MEKQMLIRNKLAALFSVLFVALAVAGCGGKEARMAKYMQKGKAHLEQQNYDKARLEFKNVLQIEPKNAAAYFYLGEVEKATRNLRLAIGYYRKAMELQPDYPEAQIKMGRFYLALGDKAKAKETADAILSKNPADAGGRTLHAAISLIDGNTSEAIKEISEVLKTNPSYAEAIDLLSSIYEKQGQKDKAIATLEEGLSANRKNVLLRMRLVQLYLDQKDLAKSESLLSEIVTAEPEVLQHRANLAIFYSRTNQLDKAENTLREAIKADPKDSQRHILLTDFLANRRDFATAEKELLSAIEANPEDFELRYGLAALYERMKRLDKMENVYRAVISSAGTSPDGLKARNFLANLLLMQNKQLDEASRLSEEVLGKNARDNEALMIKGRIALLKGKPQDAITAFRAVLKDQPASSKVLTLLADAHLANAEKDLALDNLRKALEYEPAYLPARVQLARYYASIGNVNDALKTVDEGLKAAPTDMDLLLAKVEVHAAKKDANAMRKTLETIKTAHPDSPIGYYRMGQLLAFERKYDPALREFETAWQKSPNAPEVLTAIVNTHMAQGKPDKAVNRLNEALKQSPENAFIHELLGEVHIGQKKYAEAEAQFRKAIELNPKWTQPYGSLAKLLQMRGDLPGSIRVFEQGLAAVPDDVTLMLYLASAHDRAKSYDKAIDIYERAVQINPNNAIAANNLAALLSDHRTDAKSLARARELVQRFESSQQPVFRDTLGWVYFRSGETDKAIPILEKVVSQSPQVAIFHYHLGMAYHKKGDLAAAKTHLTKAVAGKGEYSGIEEARTTLAGIR